MTFLQQSVAAVLLVLISLTISVRARQRSSGFEGQRVQPLWFYTEIAFGLDWHIACKL
jgi:hypothetical protein